MSVLLALLFPAFSASALWPSVDVDTYQWNKNNKDG